MRINNNIEALRTLGSVRLNDGAVKKSIEKLSSGLSILKAADNAAGLAISEKMRGQINGLDQAESNSNDGISLIQTAEGAMSSIHEILRRMNTLAMQSSNGVYQQEPDREALDKEYQMLLNEIQDISDRTTFNGINLLDGALSVNGKMMDRTCPVEMPPVVQEVVIGKHVDSKVFEIASDGVYTVSNDFSGVIRVLDGVCAVIKQEPNEDGTVSELTNVTIECGNDSTLYADNLNIKNFNGCEIISFKENGNLCLKGVNILTTESDVLDNHDPYMAVRVGGTVNVYNEGNVDEPGKLVIDAENTPAIGGAGRLRVSDCELSVKATGSEYAVDCSVVCFESKIKISLTNSLSTDSATLRGDLEAYDHSEVEVLNYGLGTGVRAVPEDGNKAVGTIRSSDNSRISCNKSLICVDMTADGNSEISALKDISASGSIVGKNSSISAKQNISAALGVIIDTVKLTCKSLRSESYLTALGESDILTEGDIYANGDIALADKSAAVSQLGNITALGSIYAVGESSVTIESDEQGGGKITASHSIILKDSSKMNAVDNISAGEDILVGGNAEITSDKSIFSRGRTALIESAKMTAAGNLSSGSAVMMLNSAMLTCKNLIAQGKIYLYDDTKSDICDTIDSEADVNMKGNAQIANVKNLISGGKIRLAEFIKLTVSESVTSQGDIVLSDESSLNAGSVKSEGNLYLEDKAQLQSTADVGVDLNVCVCDEAEIKATADFNSGGKITLSDSAKLISEGKISAEQDIVVSRDALMTGKNISGNGSAYIDGAVKALNGIKAEDITVGESAEINQNLSSGQNIGPDCIMECNSLITSGKIDLFKIKATDAVTFNGGNVTMHASDAGIEGKLNVNSGKVSANMNIPGPSLPPNIPIWCSTTDSLGNVECMKVKTDDDGKLHILDSDVNEAIILSGNKGYEIKKSATGYDVREIPQADMELSEVTVSLPAPQKIKVGDKYSIDGCAEIAITDSMLEGATPEGAANIKLGVYVPPSLKGRLTDEINIRITTISPLKQFDASLGSSEIGVSPIAKVANLKSPGFSSAVRVVPKLPANTQVSFTVEPNTDSHTTTVDDTGNIYLNLPKENSINSVFKVNITCQVLDDQGNMTEMQYKAVLGEKGKDGCAYLVNPSADKAVHLDVGPMEDALQPSLTVHITEFPHILAPINLTAPEAKPVQDMGSVERFDIIEVNVSGAYEIDDDFTGEIHVNAPDVRLQHKGDYRRDGYKVLDNVTIVCGSGNKNLVLDNISIFNVNGLSALKVEEGSHTVELVGDSTITNYYQSKEALVNVKQNAELVIKDRAESLETGSLKVVQAVDYATNAAIGGNMGEGTGAISIESGKVNARIAGKLVLAAAIGSGFMGKSGTINITGGVVTAETGYSSRGAAIGGGAGADGGTVNIVEAIVNAVTGEDSSGAAVGGGESYNTRPGNGGYVTMQDSIVTLSMGDNSTGAAIGGGGSSKLDLSSGSGAFLTVSGGSTAIYGGAVGHGNSVGLDGADGYTIINNGSFYIEEPSVNIHGGAHYEDGTPLYQVDTYGEYPFDSNVPIDYSINRGEHMKAITHTDGHLYLYLPDESGYKKDTNISVKYEEALYSYYLYQGCDTDVLTDHSAVAMLKMTEPDTGLLLQVGANQKDTMRIFIEDLGIRSLKMCRSNVASQDAAQAATVDIERVINTVSRERAKIGAYQSSLNHVASNVQNSHINLQAAESRIRDADMAKEAMQFAKTNILSQAAQSMLVQANVNSQKILELLK